MIATLYLQINTLVRVEFCKRAVDKLNQSIRAADLISRSVNREGCAVAQAVECRPFTAARRRSKSAAVYGNSFVRRDGVAAWN